jgi:hypothetical protein
MSAGQTVLRQATCPEDRLRLLAAAASQLSGMTFDLSSGVLQSKGQIVIKK